ncbi:hypothetical protein LX36DRAFT_658557 [Colletotrichum falcatum]|nr:hypothetical protein LX36DRAFT_658557 [Colletotrichum falcatum]
MATNIDLFEHPELLNPAKEMVRVLQVHACMVEDLESTKEKLAKGKLNSNTLGKCRDIIEFVNELEERDNFVVELSRLSLDEIAFVSICFSTRRLKTIHQDFRASRIQTYMRSQSINTSIRAEIHKRIELYMTDGHFKRIYRESSKGQLLPKCHPPGTTAETTGSLEFAGAKWVNIENLFGKAVADAIPKQDQPLTDGVRSTLSRSQGMDDVLMSLDIASEPSWLSFLFPDGSARVDRISSVFGDRIADAIDRSQLREWEIKNGLGSQTKCVRLTYNIKLRLSSSLDIPNTLY